MSDAAAQPDRPFLVVAPPALAAAALAVHAIASGSDGGRVATLAGIYALLVVGYQFVFGRLGALSLGQSAFFGLGAYVTARLATTFDLPFLITFPAAILLPAAFAGVIAAPVLRLKSHYFPLVTLGLAQLLLFGALSSGPIGDIPGVELAGLPIPRGAALAAFVWVVTIVAALLAWRLSVTLFGRFAEIARDNPLAASAVGIDAGRLGVAAFMLSAGYAGAAGALCAHMSGEATPDAFGLPVMVACLSMAVVGGRYHVSGAIVGAILLVLLSEAAGLGRYAPILWGVALLIAVIVASEGIVGALQRRYAPVAALVPPAPQPVPPRKSMRVAGPLLAARGITRRFGGIVAVDNLSLALQPGEILGLIGPNGSGKTTLVNALSGLSSAQTGRVYLAGRDVTSIPPHAVARAGLARTFETAQLADNITVLDNVAAARAVAAGVELRTILRRADADIAFARARAEAMTCLATVGLTAAAAEPAGSLSFADRRRLEVARALALNPLVVALDEPAAGLGAEDRQHLADLLRGLAQRGLGLIVVEHDVAFLRGIATRLACLDAGRLIAIGTPEAVIADPKVVAAYLGGPAIGRGRVG
jgi:branched-chain amino acid transport system permease protein